MGRAAAPDRADQTADQLLKSLGLSRARAGALKELPVDAILAAQADVARKLPMGAFGPVVDRRLAARRAQRRRARGGAADREISSAGTATR